MEGLNDKLLVAKVEGRNEKVRSHSARRGMKIKRNKKASRLPV